MSSSIQNALDAIRARAQARADDLTGLANSRYFHTRLSDEIARADRDGTELGMLFIDSRPLQGGQRSLRAPGRELDAAEGGSPPGRQRAPRRAGRPLRRRRVSWSSCRAPIWRAPRRPPRRCARRSPARDFLRHATGEPAHATRPQPPPRITASIGISSYRDHLAPGGTQRRRESTLLRLADSAMYRAKAGGRKPHSDRGP